MGSKTPKPATNRHSAFTLIEVLIAVLILTIVGTAILQTHANNTRLIEHLEGKSEVTELISLSATSFKEDNATITNENDENEHIDKTLSLYDLLDKKYDIKDEDIIKDLKDSEVRVTRVNAIKIDLGDEDTKKAIDEMINKGKPESSQQKPQTPEQNLKIVIKKLGTDYHDATTFVYKLSTEQDKSKNSK